MDLNLNLLLQLLVGLGLGCNKLLRDRLTNLLEKRIQMKVIHQRVNVLPKEIPNVLGCEWRVLHPFELPGVRFPTDSTPPNQRRLAENDALVELIQTTKYLEDTPVWGQRDYRIIL